MGSRWYALTVDATDPARLARWWAEVLSCRVLAENTDEVVIGIGKGTHPVICFTRSTPERSGRSRLHLDLRPDDRESEVERLVNMGARHVGSRPNGDGWMVLADPEGNEFSVFRTRQPL